MGNVDFPLCYLVYIDGDGKGVFNSDNWSLVMVRVLHVICTLFGDLDPMDY
jgi:hypothetical protein